MNPRTSNQGPIVASRAGTGRRVWFASLKASPRISNCERWKVDQLSAAQVRNIEREKTYEVVDETPDRRKRPADGKHADVTELGRHFSVFASEIGSWEKLFPTNPFEEYLFVFRIVEGHLLVIYRTGTSFVLDEAFRVEFFCNLRSESSFEVRDTNFGEGSSDLSGEGVGDELTLEFVSVDDEFARLDRSDGGTSDCVSVTRWEDVEDVRNEERSEGNLQIGSSVSSVLLRQRRREKTTHVDETRKEKITVGSDKVESEELDRQ